jgi:hypothetical protein
MPKDEEKISESEDQSMAAFATFKGRFKTDIQAIKKMDSSFGSLAKSLREVNAELGKMIDRGRDAQISLQGVAQSSASGSGSAPVHDVGSSTTAGGIKTTTAPLSSGTWGKFTNMLAGATGQTGEKNAFGGRTAWGAVGQAVMQQMTAGINWAGARSQGAAPYMLTADRTGMLYRQMYGGTQLQYQNKYRAPLTGPRSDPLLLGNGGVESMLALQATTGLNATQMAQGVQGMRVSSGFGYSTGAANAMIGALAAPGSSNLMTIMTGMGLYGPGGKANDPMDVIRNTVQRMGLTSQRMVQGAFQPGSMTRANLSRSGLPEDMQNMVLQYAQQNLEYRSKGGEGMYDPAKREHRQRMGVEEGYATEFERTRVEETRREERFYNRQVDNYDRMEHNTQALIRVASAIEDRFSTLVGAKISATNNPWLRGAGQAASVLGPTLLGIGAGATALGMATTATGVGAPIGMGLMAVGGLLTAMSGDPDDVIQPGMEAGFSGNLRAMATAAEKEGHVLSLTSGVRTEADQKALFLDRHDEDPNGNRVYNGKTYSLNAAGRAKGYAAPPGHSLHQLGMAADLGPRSAWTWIGANASRFGLRVAEGEPWHVARIGAKAPVGTKFGTSGHRASASSTTAPRSDAMIYPHGLSVPDTQTAMRASHPSANLMTGDGESGGSVITISPTIHLTGTGSSAADAQTLANQIIRLIENSTAVDTLRRS